MKKKNPTERLYAFRAGVYGIGIGPVDFATFNESIAILSPFRKDKEIVAWLWSHEFYMNDDIKRALPGWTFDDGISFEEILKAKEQFDKGILRNIAMGHWGSIGYLVAEREEDVMRALNIQDVVSIGDDIDETQEPRSVLKLR